MSTWALTMTVQAKIGAADEDDFEAKRDDLIERMERMLGKGCSIDIELEEEVDTSYSDDEVEEAGEGYEDEDEDGGER